MSADLLISRRAFAGSLALLGLSGKEASAQGFAGLGQSAQGYAAVTPGRKFSFPTDHGPHPEYRIEWWYVTANLADKDDVRILPQKCAQSSGKVQADLLFHLHLVDALQLKFHRIFCSHNVRVGSV